jgi:hypothetical protein
LRHRALHSDDLTPERPVPTSKKTKGKINAEWHAGNRMPANASSETRLAWHREHQKHCACRPIPEKLQTLVKKKTRAKRGD